jgi:hypothetical protein
MASPHSSLNESSTQSPEYLTWDYAAQPVIIRLRANLIQALHRASPDCPLDGFLLGDVLPGPRPTVQIDLCLPVDSGYFEGPTNGDAETLGRMLAGFRKEQERSHVVGYFRSRSLRNRNLSSVERALMQAHFKSKTDVFLVVDPAGEQFSMEFFNWSSGDLRPYDMRGVQRTPPRRAALPVVLSKRTLAAMLPVAVTVCAVLLSFFAGTPVHTKPNAPGPAEEISLGVARSGADYLVSWSRDLAARYAGSTATLEIEDAGRRKVIAVNHDLLRGGRILYAPASPNVQFRFAVAVAPGKEISEAVQTIAADLGERSRVRSKDFNPAQPPLIVERITPAAASRAFRQPALGREIPQLRAPRIDGRQFVPPAPLVPVSQIADPVDVQVRPAHAMDLQAPMPAPEVRASLPEPDRPAARPEPQSVTVPPSVIRQVPLVIPAETKRFINDDVTLRVKATIDSAGRVIRAEALTKGGYVVTNLSRTAEENARHWVFSPARVDNKPATSEFVIEYQVKARRAQF